MQKLIDEFCIEWKAKGDDLEEFKNATICMITDVQKQFITNQIKNPIDEDEDCNLHSEFETLMDEIKFMREELKYIRERDESLKTAIIESNKELKNEIGKKKSSSSRKDYGLFSSKIAKDFADENGINGEDIEGTGKNNKVTKKDIQKILSQTKAKEKKSKKKTTKKKKEKRPCNATKGSGSPCGNSGNVLIRGKFYCGKHVKQAKEEAEDLSEDEYSDYDENEDKPLVFHRSIEEDLAKYREESLKNSEGIDSDFDEMKPDSRQEIDFEEEYDE